jgi:hypothetical protein
MTTARLAGSILLLLAAIVCGYLFLAGFEYPGVTRFKLVTGTLCLFFLGLSSFFASRKATR